jgi:uncharacterized protein
MIVVGLLLALLVGASLGLLGGGGSILTVPLLHYVFGHSVHAAVAGSLLVVGLTAAAALVPHARAGRVRWRTGLGFGAASMAGAYAAGKLARHLPPAVLLTGFAVVVVATAVAMLRRRPPPTGTTPRPVRPGWIVVEGLAVGAVTGLVGAGGGFLVVPALALLAGLPMPQAIATSLLVIALKSFAALAGAAGQVSLDLPLLGAIAAIAIAGSVIGGRLVARVPAARLQAGFGWFVLTMAAVVLAQQAPAVVGDVYRWLHG